MLVVVGEVVALDVAAVGDLVEVKKVHEGHCCLVDVESEEEYFDCQVGVLGP